MPTAFLLHCRSFSISRRLLTTSVHALCYFARSYTHFSRAQRAIFSCASSSLDHLNSYTRSLSPLLLVQPDRSSLGRSHTLAHSQGPHPLQCEKLNPEISSLEDVIAAAETIEIAQSVPAETSTRGRNQTSNMVRSAAAMPDGNERPTSGNW